MKRYNIIRIQGIFKAREPDMEIDSNIYVEGIPYIIADLIVECTSDGSVFEKEFRFNTTADVQAAIDKGYIMSGD